MADEKIDANSDENIEEKKGDQVVVRLIDDEVSSSYLAYAMSVIVGRALPDVRDGLKPVHRRILYAMWDLGMLHNKPYKKCARIVGEVLGKYHPHGDMAVYQSLARMAQTFSLRYTLIEGQGNFGSVDGDSPAAMRYTEARLNKVAEEILQDLEKETVAFIANFDGSLKEPTVLPSKVPNLLVNGSSGIAVGMATNMLPHNLKEVCNGVIATINKPDITVEELMQHIPAPDFPTGGILYAGSELGNAYAMGRGKVVVRAKTHVEEGKTKKSIIVTEIPYQVNKSVLIESIADMVRDKKIDGISDIRDESDRQGMRIVFTLKNSANPDVVLNQLFKHSRLQESFGIINLALVNNQPTILSLKDLIVNYIKYRQEIVRKRTEYDLKVAQDKAHILEGLIICLDNLDDVVALIRKSKDPAIAKAGLIADYKLSEKQAQAVLEMRLSRLTNLEQASIRTDHTDLLKVIEELLSILASEQKILGIIKNELIELSAKFGDDRKTQVIGKSAVVVEDQHLVPKQDVVVTITNEGYVKRISADTYSAQKRGGKGIIGTETKEEDIVKKLFIANTHDWLLLFTNFGKVHWIKVYEVPEAGRYAKGSSIANLIMLAPEEKVTATIPATSFKEKYLFFATKNGVVKKTSLAEFSNPRKGGIIALGIEDKDALVSVLLTKGENEIILATSQGQAIRFKEENVRPMGRTATGVYGIRMAEGDTLVSATIADPESTLLTISENGYGKRTPLDEYRTTGRGGTGVTNFKITDKTGNVVDVENVRENEEVIIITQAGIVLRTAVKDISLIGRSTQGVRLIRVDEGDKVMSVAIVKQE